MKTPSKESQNPADVWLRWYYIVVGLFIAAGALAGRLPRWPLFLGHHIAVLVAQEVFLRRYREKNRLLLFIRLVYPMFLFGSMYRETHELDQVIFARPLDLYFAGWDQIIFRCQPSIEFSRVLPGALFSELMHLGYFSYFGIIVLLPLIWWFRRRPEMVRRRVFDLTFTFSVFYLIFIILPVQGPRVQLPGAIDVPRTGYLFGPFFEWLFRSAGIAGAAFPSSHCGVASLVLANSVRDIPKRWPIVAIFTLMLYLATVYGRFHYAVDVVYGAGLGLICYIASPYLYKFLSRNLDKT